MGFLRLLESIRIPALNVFFSGITYCGDEIAFMVVAFALFWCVNKRTGYYAFLVGLFGTVWGIINSFNAIATTQSNSLSAMAPGIAEALFTTAFGLIAAIPAVVAYNKISSDIDRYAKKLENFMGEFSTILSREIDDTAIKADMAGE